MRSSGRLFVLSLLLLVGAGCEGLSTTHEVIQELPSPSGEWRAMVTRWQPPGGPLADDQYSIHVVRAGDAMPHWIRGIRRARALWFSEWIDPTYVFWRDDRSLVVLVARPTDDGRYWVRHGRSRFRIETRWLPYREKAFVRRVDELSGVMIRGG